MPYTGQARRFTLDGHVIDVSSEMDAFIHYRKAFKHAAKYMRDILMNDYNTQVINLDEYFSKFPIMYVHYRRYLVDAAVKILVSNDIYDISREEFETELARDFSACNRLYESLTNLNRGDTWSIVETVEQLWKILLSFAVNAERQMGC